MSRVRGDQRFLDDVSEWFDGETTLDKMNLPTRKGIIVMMVVTGIYLMFEVAFAARLLDVVGSTTDLDEIEQIETAGRFISGIALTLVAWSAFVLPRIRKARLSGKRRRFPRLRAAWSLGVSAAICCTISYVTQEKILETISEASSPAQRRAAATLTLISASVQTDHARLDDIDLGAIGRDTPEVKTFMALLPALALSVDRLEERTDDAIQSLLERQAREALGDPGIFFTDVYYPSMNALKTAYVEVYQEVAPDHRKARLEIPAQQDKAYWDYRRSLGRPKPWEIPSYRHASVRQNVRDSGIPVAHDWDLVDRTPFEQAVENRVRAEIDPPYQDAMIKAFGRVLPDDLTADTFFADEDVQHVWRDRIGAPEAMKLEPDLSPEAFKSDIYDTWVRMAVAERKPVYLADIEDFETGGRYHDDGVEAIRVAYVPLVAFGFSILGALVHSFKTLNFAALAVIGLDSLEKLRRAKKVKLVLAACVIGLGVVMARSENGVTRSVLFKDLEARTAEVGSPVLSTAIRSVVQLQSHVYPVAEAIRSTVLLGITYDFDPDTDIPAFELLSGNSD